MRAYEDSALAFKRVIGMENILFSIAPAVLSAPDDPVRPVAYPAMNGRCGTWSRG